MKRRIKKRLNKSNDSKDQKPLSTSNDQWWWLHEVNPFPLMADVSYRYGNSNLYPYLHIPCCFLNNVSKGGYKMKIDIYKAKWNGKELEPVNIGYIELDKFNEDECWHLCNWSCWSKIKPDNLYSKITECNTDVIFHNPENNMYYTPGFSGWNEPLPMLDACVVYWLNDFSTLPSTKAVYDYLQKTGKTFEEIYLEDN